MSTPVAGRFVTGLCLFPGSVRTNAGEGSGSRLDRRSTRAAGLALTPIPSGAESVAPGTRLWVLWVAVFSSVRSGRFGGTGCPVAGHPFAAGVGGMEWYGRSQAGSIRSSTAPPGWGSDQQRPRVLAAPELMLTLVGPGNGCARRAARSRPG